MQVTINSISETEREAAIALTQDELQPQFEVAYAEYRPKVDMKGFRKGRVPLPIIKQVYGQAIEYEALDAIASATFRKAMLEQKLDPIGRPTLSDYDFRRGEGFSFKVKFELRPVITLKKYKGIALTRHVHTVTDAELQEEVERLRRINATAEPAEKVLDENYAVTADVQETDAAGLPLPGRKTPGVRFHLVDPEVAPQIKEALKTAEVGGTSTVTFESRHGDHSHTSYLSLTVTKVEKVTLPPFDDALAAKVTRDRVKSADELKSGIRKDMEQYWTDLTNRRLEDELATEIVKANDFVVPNALVEGFLDAMVQEMKDRSRDRRLPQGFDEPKYRAESRDNAVWQAKWMLLKERIAEVEAITVVDADLEALAERDAASMGISKDRLLQHYKTSESARDRLLSTKVVAFLNTHAAITDVPEASAL